MDDDEKIIYFDDETDEDTLDFIDYGNDDE
jgi:hypothetical protein